MKCASVRDFWTHRLLVWSGTLLLRNYNEIATWEKNVRERSHGKHIYRLMGVYWKEIRYFISISICFWASALTCHQIGIPLICILMHCIIYEEQVCYQGGFIILSMYNFNAYNIKKWCPNKRHSHNSRKYLVIRSKCTNILQETYESICCLS